MSTERADNKPLPDPLRDTLAPRPLSDQKPPTTPTGGTVGGPRRGEGDGKATLPKPSGRVLRSGKTS